jgi:hypothetical protein
LKNLPLFAIITPFSVFLTTADFVVMVRRRDDGTNGNNGTNGKPICLVHQELDKAVLSWLAYLSAPYLGVPLV